MDKIEKFIKVYVVVGIYINEFGIINHNVEGVLTTLEDTEILLEYLRKGNKNARYVYHQKLLQMPKALEE